MFGVPCVRMCAHAAVRGCAGPPTRTCPGIGRRRGRYPEASPAPGPVARAHRRRTQHAAPRAAALPRVLCSVRLVLPGAAACPVCASAPCARVCVCACCYCAVLSMCCLLLLPSCCRCMCLPPTEQQGRGLTISGCQASVSSHERTPDAPQTEMIRALLLEGSLYLLHGLRSLTIAVAVGDVQPVVDPHQHLHDLIDQLDRPDRKACLLLQLKSQQRLTERRAFLRQSSAFLLLQSPPPAIADTVVSQMLGSSLLLPSSSLPPLFRLSPFISSLLLSSSLPSSPLSSSLHLLLSSPLLLLLLLLLLSPPCHAPRAKTPDPLRCVWVWVWVWVWGGAAGCGTCSIFFQLVRNLDSSSFIRLAATPTRPDSTKEMRCSGVDRVGSSLWCREDAVRPASLKFARTIVWSGANEPSRRRDCHSAALPLSLE